MKIHTSIFDNENKGLCGAKIDIFNKQPAYSFKGKYNHLTHCKKCYSTIKKWNCIKPKTEADIIKEEGRY